jgi:hypothetical protein
MSCRGSCRLDMLDWFSPHDHASRSIIILYVSSNCNQKEGSPAVAPPQTFAAAAARARGLAVAVA